MKDGIVEPSTPRGKALGFTKEKFGGYLWIHGEYVWISAIISHDEGKGNLSKLFNSIFTKGYGIKVPTAFPRMEAIVRRKGFEKTIEIIEETGEKVEVWVHKRIIGVQCTHCGSKNTRKYLEPYPHWECYKCHQDFREDDK